MSLLEWLKFWSKFYSLPLFCRIPPPPSLSMKIVRESKSDYRIPPQKWKLSESPSQSTQYPPTPQNENCQRVQVRVQNTPQNENCQRVQVRVQHTPQMKIVRVQIPVSEYPPMKIVRESKSESFRIPPQIKIVRESKSESFRIPPPPKTGKTSDFKLQISLKIQEIYVETNLSPPRDTTRSTLCSKRVADPGVRKLACRAFPSKTSRLTNKPWACGTAVSLAVKNPLINDTSLTNWVIHQKNGGTDLQFGKVLIFEVARRTL